MRDKIYVHNKKVNTWAKSLSEKVINISLGFVLVASPVIGIILPKTVHAATAGDVVINEFVSNGDEWVELLNTTGSTISLTSWTLSDETGVFKTFGVSDSVDGYSFFVYDIPSSRLNNSGDSVILNDAGSTEIDSVTYPSDVAVPGAGQSAGRTTDGGASFTVFSTPTMGAPNAPDTTNPEVTPTQPDVGPKYFNQHSSFKAIMTDEGLGNTGIATGTFRIWNGSGDTGLVNMGDGDNDDEYAGSTNTNLLPDGIYQIDFTATDNAGNSTTTTVNNIVIDNTTPLADITSPSSGDTVSGAVNIFGNGSDTNLRGYNLRIYQTGSINPAGLVKTFGHVNVVGGSFSGLLASWIARQFQMATTQFNYPYVMAHSIQPMTTYP